MPTQSHPACTDNPNKLPDDASRDWGKYAAVIRRFARTLTGNDADADDLAQSAVVSAFAGRAGFRGNSSVIAWLRGIAARKWRDSLRKRREAASDMADVVEEASDPAAPVSQRVIERVALQDALSRLDPRARHALLLTASQGLTYRQASQITGEPVGTVKWRVAEAMRKMRILLEETEGEQ